MKYTEILRKGKSFNSRYILLMFTYIFNPSDIGIKHKLRTQFLTVDFTTIFAPYPKTVDLDAMFGTRNKVCLVQK